ncbi:TetR/AcrR family transcriptional regulator [Nocardia miyunensis]|uniref:TetR/AcrR family transcriptional regulator n=1 Tax=Nocardia miyunensis TaxID=282684 RepID=UPI00082CD4DD|nr:TetR/AcrR family transcriptional regulator [Nocardia miyunensis]
MSVSTQTGRARGEARNAILVSARKLFGAKGYHGASMRDVAQHAGVSEALLYRYFGAKPALFEEAVRVPYRGFIEEFLADWEHLEVRLSNEEMVTRFVTRLYDFVLAHRDIIFALAAANRFEDLAIDEASTLTAGIHRLTEYIATEAESRGFGHADLEMVAVCTIGLVMAVGILDDLLFPAGADHPAKERMISEMCKYVLAGVQQPADDHRAHSSGH